MTRQNFPLLYFGLFATCLAFFNWNDNWPVCSLFLVGALTALIQVVRPNLFLHKALFVLAAIFCLSYAGVIVRVMIDAGDITPFSPNVNRIFLWNCLVALLNFFVLLLWYKNSFHPDKNQIVEGRA